MQVSDEITQYAPLEGDFEKTAEILLLVRPDYTVFDEVRKTRDFEIFTDLRLAGVGMVGVVHASKPIDAIQRFISRVDIGVLPHVVDTIIFIKEGEIKKVYELSLKVKVPTGMTQEDLARPVVEVRDFETGKLEYEIYTYGEENVVVPIEKEKVDVVKKLAEERVLMEIRRYDPKASVEIVGNKALVKVDNRVIGRLIGKDGENISRLEKKLGLRIEVLPKYYTLGNEVQFQISESGNSIDLVFDKSLAGEVVSFYIDGEFLFSAMVGKKGAIKISKESDIGKELLKAIYEKREIKAFARG
jgi:ATPase